MTSVSRLPSYLYYLESLNIPLRIDLPTLPTFAIQLSRSSTPTVPKATCHSPMYDWNIDKNDKDMINDLLEIEELISFDLSFHSYDSSYSSYKK